MAARASFYAPEPGTSLPTASASAIFVSSLQQILEETAAPLEVRTHRIGGVTTPGRGAPPAFRRRLTEFGRIFVDRSRYLVLTYPHAPMLASNSGGLERPISEAWTTWGYRVLRGLRHLDRQRLVVVIEHLPLERAQGRAVAGDRGARINAEPISAVERTLFRSAYRLIAPIGLKDKIQERYGIGADRFRTFRRHIYRSAFETESIEGVEIEGGTVNVFFSGSVDSHIAGNFREILRSMRNAPQTRLHVCGPGGDSVREWLSELDVPNARHYGKLAQPQYDWLAQQCDIGLILEPSDNPYNHYVPTHKYSAYLANGLAILSSDLRAVSENIRSDGVGQAMPIRELSVELMRWATRPSLWSNYKSRASQLSAQIRSGAEWKDWVQELIEDR